MCIHLDSWDNRWRGSDDEPVGEFSDSPYQTAKENEARKKLFHLQKSSPCRYEVLNELVNLRLAADELNFDYYEKHNHQSIYWFRDDYTSTNGVVQINEAEGSSLSQARYFNSHDHPDPGCENHLTMLLAKDNTMLKNAFGDSFYEAHLSVFAPFRAVWHNILTAMNATDDGWDSGE